MIYNRNNQLRCDDAGSIPAASTIDYPLNINKLDNQMPPQKGAPQRQFSISFQSGQTGLAPLISLSVSCSYSNGLFRLDPSFCFPHSSVEIMGLCIDDFNFVEFWMGGI